MHKNVIMACHISGIHDVNRNTTIPDDDYSIVKDWADSIIDLKLGGIIFHNNFSIETCQKHQNEYIRFVKIDFDYRYNPNVYRYMIYDDYLQRNYHLFDNIFLTDISDVVLVQNPFNQPLYCQNMNAIFCGDEPKTLHNEWMQAHSEHLRSRINDYAKYEERFYNSTLLNCGIVGGNIKVMLEFISKLATIHRMYNNDNQTAYTGDMGAFNYLIHTEFEELYFHGEPINTEFKAYQTQRKDCWFRHK